MMAEPGCLHRFDLDHPESCVSGSLQTWPLSDMLYWLHKTHRSAMLRVGEGIDAGVLFFHQGFLFRCEFGPLSGEAALRTLLEHSGNRRFALLQREVPKVRANIQTPTELLLLRCAVAQDEHRMHAAS